MAFSFSNAASSGSAAGASQGANVRDGPELQEIQTNELGFAAINGEAKVRLLPTPWPSDALPPPSSSLLSVASTKGLLAAAGPDALYIASTNKVRDAFASSPSSDSKTIRHFAPDFKIPQNRLFHVAFSSDDSVLVVSPAEGGILAFQVDSIQKGQFDPALQLSTNGQSLRAVVPNPYPESAQLFAIITTNGDLMLVDLQAGTMISGSNGSVLRSNATCLSWSKKGRQLVAGMADGSVVQMKPDGTVVAQIPKSTTIPSSSHVSGISWLDNDTFFIIYTPNDTSEDIPPSEYYMIHREQTTNYTFQKLPEVLPPFGVERLPTFHFISRLRDFPPNIEDLLLVAATTATDIGLISKAKKALSQEDQVISSFTFTTIEDDTRRAQLPLSSEMQDTSPIGMVVDLSSTEKVPNPIPADPDILETDGPVPCLLVLNNEGILVAWWIIYNDSIREKTTFSGLKAVQNARNTSALVAHTPSPPLRSTASPFGDSSSTSAFAKPASSGFGISTGQPVFGSTTTKPFGNSSPITSDKPSWASTGFGNNATASNSAFGKPAFGSATPIGGNNAPAFGAASALGSRPSPFGQPSALGGAPPFVQPSAFGASSTASPFARAGDSSSGPGFASFSKGGGFSSFAGGNTEQSSQSPFSAATGKSLFAQASGNTFGSDKSVTSPFAAAKSNEGQVSFGNFKMQSSFHGDGSAKDDLPRPKEPSGSGFGFGASFGDILGESRGPLSPTRDQETEMDEESEANEDDSDIGQKTTLQGFSDQNLNKTPQTLVTPPSTLTQSKATPAPPLSNLFGQVDQTTTTPQPQTTMPGWSFNGMPSTTPKDTPNPSHMALFGAKTAANDTPATLQKSEPAQTSDALSRPPEIKEEPPSDDESVDLQNVPEAPLPPDTISKPRYASGDTSISSDVSKSPPDDAPLPPDFAPTPKGPEADDGEPQKELASESEDAFSSDLEGSAEDVEDEVEDEVSQEEEEDVADDQHEQLETSPESSFKSGDRSPETSPTGGLFTKVSSNTTAQKPPRKLFGEVGTGPIFAPPPAQESPRSPSPVRNILSSEGLRVDPSRSVSAPAHPRSVIDQRKAEYQQSPLAAQAARLKEEEAAKQKARREAVERQKAQAEAEQVEPLEDDEDERLRQELERPISPTQSLDDFITYQPKPSQGTSKSGIPAQIERLYSDINSMVYTLGINSRSLSAFMEYQQPEAANQSWPAVLKSETPLDALNDELFLIDIARLQEGQGVLSAILTDSKVEDFDGTLRQGQALLSQDLSELRTKVQSIRKTLHALSTAGGETTAPLSAEQSSIQHDLRKAFTSVQTKMVEIEDGISILRAKVAQFTSAETSKRLSLGPSQKKPTVEAVTKTVLKMMSMAEQKSADIDVLEAQLKKMDLSLTVSTLSNGDASRGQGSITTPQRNRQSMNGATPGSAGSVYHTPDSKFGNSTRSSRGLRTSQNGGLTMVSAEDQERWRAQSRRKKEAASMLKQVLEEKRKRMANR